MLQKWLLFVLLISLINEIQPKNGDNQQPSPNNQILSQTGNDSTQQSPAQQPEPQPPPPPLPPSPTPTLITPPPPPPTSSKPCHELTEEQGASFDKFHDCKFVADSPFVGNWQKLVRLDFSGVKSDADFTTFFSQAQKSVTLMAALRLVDNNKITNADFGKVGTWTKSAAEISTGTLIIEIFNNVNLMKFLIDNMSSFDFGTDIKVKVFVYNNPMMTWTPKTVTMIKEKMTDDSFFETEKDACTFQNPQDKTQSIKPTPELLPKCKIFRGDLKLESVSLSGDITFTDGCLYLVKVNMKNVTKITAEAGKGHENCKLAGVKSKIEKNPGLCGDKMAAVAAYMPKVEPKLDDTCTVICKDQDTVKNKFYRCAKIEVDFIDVEHWFTTGYEDIAEKLTAAKGIAITGKSDVTKIDFPVLKTVTSLEIRGNGMLKELNLRKLENAGTLIIENNMRLMWTEIKKLPKSLKKAPGSVVECNTDKNTIVTDIEDLRHCTKIIGKLIIRNVKKDVNPADFNIKEITECITIENTELSNLEFLENADIPCAVEHILTGNRNLCMPQFLRARGAKVVPINGKNTGCGKKCTSLRKKNCVIFEGDLIVDDKTLADDLAALEVINGKLTITGFAESFKFPSLTTIISSKAPALIVTNNPKLESIKMPKIEKIEAGGEQPAVKIENSPNLKNLKDFLPAKIADTCSRSASTSCQYDKTEETEENSMDNIALLAGIAAGAVILGAAGAGGGFFLYKRNKKKKESKVKTKAKTPTKSDEKAKTPTKSDDKAKIPTKSDDNGGCGTIVDKSPTFEVLDAIQMRNPETTNTAYLYSIADSVVKLPLGTVLFRLFLRKKHTDADVAAGKIEQFFLYFYESIHDEESKIPSDRLGLNRHVYLVNEQYQHNLPEFKNAMLTAVQKKKVDKKQEKKKEPTKEKKLDEKKTEKERTKAGKGGKKEDGKNSKEKGTKETEKNTAKTDKMTKKSAESGEDTSMTPKPAAPAAKEHQKIKLIHIGPGFKKSMNFLKELKISPLTEADGKPFRKLSDKFSSLRSSLILMEYTDGTETQTREVELTEMIVPELVIGQLHNLIQCPWVSLLYYAWQNNIVIHTSVPDYLVCSFYFYSAIDLLNYRIKKDADITAVSHYGMTTMYPGYHQLFAGPNQQDFDEITAYTIYVTCMLEWLREYIPADNGVAQEVKKVIRQLLVVDQIVHKRWKEKKTDSVHWDIYVRGEPDINKHVFSTGAAPLHYYSCNHDTTPYYLPPPAEKLKYSPILEYDENLDCLTREVEPVSILQKPVINCDIKTEIEAGSVDTIDEAVAEGEKKKKKKAEEKTGNNPDTKEKKKTEGETGNIE